MTELCNISLSKYVSSAHLLCYYKCQNHNKISPLTPALTSYCCIKCCKNKSKSLQVPSDFITTLAVINIVGDNTTQLHHQ